MSAGIPARSIQCFRRLAGSPLTLKSGTPISTPRSLVCDMYVAQCLPNGTDRGTCKCILYASALHLSDNPLHPLPSAAGGLICSRTALLILSSHGCHPRATASASMMLASSS
eukprot:5066607-Pyramimonas_sp.AAC.1